jgi:hypothetical protein
MLQYVQRLIKSRDDKFLEVLNLISFGAPSMPAGYEACRLAELARTLVLLAAPR